MKQTLQGERGMVGNEANQLHYNEQGHQITLFTKLIQEFLPIHYMT